MAVVTSRGQFASMSVSLDFTASGPMLRLNITQYPPSTALNQRQVQSLPALLHLVVKGMGNETNSPTRLQVVSISIGYAPDEPQDNPERQKGTQDRSSGESQSSAARIKNTTGSPKPSSDHILNDPKQTDRGADNRGHPEKAAPPHKHESAESRPGDVTTQSDSNDNADTIRKNLLSPSTKLSPEQKPGPELAKQSEHNKAGHNPDEASQPRKSAPGDQSSAKQTGREGARQGSASDARHHTGTGSDKSLARGQTHTGNTATGANSNTNAQNTSQAGQTLLNTAAALINMAQPQMMEGPKQLPVIILNNPGSNNRSSDRKKSRREEEKEKEKEHEQERRERSADPYDEDLDN